MQGIMNYPQINIRKSIQHLLFFALIIIVSCSSPEQQLARRVKEYNQQPSTVVISSGFDNDGNPFILLTDGGAILIDSLKTPAAPVRILGLNTTVKKIAYNLYFKKGETLAIRRKKSQPKLLKELIDVPVSDYFSRVRIVGVPDKQAFVIAENDGVCFYYSLDRKDEIYVMYGVDLDEVKSSATIGSVLVGNLNENEFWYPHWEQDGLYDFLNNRDHLFFVPVTFDSNMMLIGMSNNLIYHAKEYPLSTLNESGGKIAQVLEGDLRADQLRRKPTPLPITAQANNKPRTASSSSTQSQTTFKEDVGDVLEFLSLAGEFGIFTEEINEISTALRILDLFL